MVLDRVLLYDTTLRDGTQGVGVSLSLVDKLQLCERLDRFGVDYVEGGWPGSNPKDEEFFRRAAGLRLRHARLCAFGSTRRAGSAVDQDANVRELLATGTPVVTVFGKSWDLHVREALHTTLEENLRMIGDTVAYLKAQGREVVYDAEHFFDGCVADGDYALATAQAAAAAGADWIVLCDTNGGSLPDEVAARTRWAVAALDRPVGIHTHNDAACGVANALAAVRAGARQVQGTINGMGERCGNADLGATAANLLLKMGYTCHAADQLGELTALCRYVSELANLPPDPGAPYVGANAFAHKGGIHVSAVNRNPLTYEHVVPERVGNRRHVVVSELSGGSNLLYKARERGLDWIDAGGRSRLLKRVKQMEFEGYAFEAAEASFDLLARKVLRPYEPFFTLDGYHVSIHKRGHEAAAYAEATVKLRVGDQAFHTAADGDGPVNALDAALRQALEGPYPELRRVRLCDFKVRVIDGVAGTGARVRVLIETKHDDGQYWTTIGVSENIIEASWLALIDGVEYGLLLHRPGALPSEDAGGGVG